ncbi:exonuclease V subunit gamma, partial [Salmonella enterica subsp. enterica serovar Enteritidis str. 6.0562-1]
MAGAGQYVTFGNLRLAQRHGAAHRIVAGNDFGFTAAANTCPTGSGNRYFITWLQMTLSQKFGIAANIAFPLPASFIWEMFVRVLPDIPKESAFSKQSMSWKLMTLLPQLLDKDEFVLLRHY